MIIFCHKPSRLGFLMQETRGGTSSCGDSHKPRRLGFLMQGGSQEKKAMANCHKPSRLGFLMQENTMTKFFLNGSQTQPAGIPYAGFVATLLGLPQVTNPAGWDSLCR